MKHTFAILMTLAFAAPAWAEPAITTLSVHPPDISLNTKSDLQRLVVVATRDDGVTLDVTAQAAVKLVDASLCKLDKQTLYPQSDGQTTLEVEYQGLKAAATINVKDAAVDR